MKEKPFIFIATPEYGSLHAWTRDRVNAMVFWLTRNKYRFYSPYSPHGVSIIPQVRNFIAKSFLNSDAEYLLSIDSDMIFPEDLVEKLIASDKDIMCGLYVRKQPPNYPMLAQLSNETGAMRPHQVSDFPKDRIFPMDGKIADMCAIGVSLIKRKVFEGMKYPYFYCPKSHEDGGFILGEDWIFCLDARKAGFEIWVDPVLGKEIFHIGDYPFGLRDFEAYKKNNDIKEVDNINMEQKNCFEDKYRYAQIDESIKLENIIQDIAE